MNGSRNEPPRGPLLALNLELSGGRHAASARLEVHGGGAAPGRRTARLTLRGWIDERAGRRLERALEGLAARGVDHVVLDCAGVQHLGDRPGRRVLEAVRRLERGGGAERGAPAARTLDPARRGRSTAAGEPVRSPRPARPREPSGELAT